MLALPANCSSIRINRGALVENGVCWRQLSDDELNRLMHWAVAEGTRLADRPRLVRLFGILAADIRFELWTRSQSLRQEPLTAEAQCVSFRLAGDALTH
jgi:hypothetical protein